jgi:DNA mismatch endonuclease (patch repair protein)
MSQKSVKRRRLKARGRGRRRDPLSPIERSLQMAKVRSRKNRSTEMRVAACLVRHGLRGWKRDVQNVPGRPDFCFGSRRVAIFVDGCFWHGCPICKRNVPQSRRRFWYEKIASNQRRDRKVGRILKSEGYVVIRIWEHALGDNRWMARLRSALLRAPDGYSKRVRSASASGFATASASATGTALPICRMQPHHEPSNAQSSGKPCKRAHSRTVR